MGNGGRGRVIPGFLIKNFTCEMVADEFEDMLHEERGVCGWDVSRRTFKRFLDDKTLFADEKCCIVLEGVILNKKELFERYDVSSVEDLIREMRLVEGEYFFNAFRGSFSGAYYDGDAAAWTIWTNHYGNNAVFYYASDGKVCVGSNFWEVLRATKSQAEVSIDERAVISMLTYGGMNDEQTYVQEIKRLLPGHYLRIAADGVCHIGEYWHFSHNAYDLSSASESEIIVELDERFRKAVDRQFGKDAEYGYRHLAELSGGLDSRMISWVAHDLGYRDVVDISFGQAGCLDETIAKRLSTDLDNQFMFMPLDDAGFLRDLDEIIQLNFGLTVYSGTSGLRRFLSNLDTDSFGLIHSGTLGDVVIGSYLGDPTEVTSFRVGGLYSPMLMENAEAITDFSKYGNQEEYLVSTRGFLTAATSDLVRRGFSDVASPFLDLDVFEYCMSIPLEYRCGHRLYKDWILGCYPEAARYVWEKNGVPLSAGRLRTWLSGKFKVAKTLGVRGSCEVILTRLGLRGASADSLRGGMTPIDLWFARHPGIKNALDAKYREGIDILVACAPDLQNMVCHAYEQGSSTETLLALTAVHAVRRILGE